MGPKASEILKKYGIKARSSKEFNKGREEVKVDVKVLRRELKQAGRKYVYDLPKEVLVEYTKASKADDKALIEKYEAMGRKNYERYNK
jgi:hypothetical protein